jgi:hypothetical protein
MAHTTCLVCLISTVSGSSKKERKKEAKNAIGRCGTRSGYTTKLEQFISLDIYGK